MSQMEQRPDNATTEPTKKDGLASVAIIVLAVVLIVFVASRLV
jgi:hypothetical protein